MREWTDQQQWVCVCELLHETMPGRPATSTVDNRLLRARMCQLRSLSSMPINHIAASLCCCQEAYSLCIMDLIEINVFQQLSDMFVIFTSQCTATDHVYTAPLQLSFNFNKHHKRVFFLESLTCSCVVTRLQVIWQSPSTGRYVDTH